MAYLHLDYMKKSLTLVRYFSARVVRLVAAKIQHFFILSSVFKVFFRKCLKKTLKSRKKHYLCEIEGRTKV